jgi:ferredoxin
MDTQTMWVDSDRCTGCGACVEVCPAGAMALVEGKARVDEETCIGCGSCADECPEGAIQPVVHGELVPAPVGARLPRPYQPGPLAQTAGAAVVVAGTGLLVKTAGALARAVGRWLVRRPAATRPPARSGASPAGDRDGTGRQRRHRRRGE